MEITERINSMVMAGLIGALVFGLVWAGWRILRTRSRRQDRQQERCQAMLSTLNLLYSAADDIILQHRSVIERASRLIALKRQSIPAEEIDWRGWEGLLQSAEFKKARELTLYVIVTANVSFTTTRVYLHKLHQQHLWLASRYRELLARESYEQMPEDRYLALWQQIHDVVEEFEARITLVMDGALLAYERAAEESDMASVMPAVGTIPSDMAGVRLPRSEARRMQRDTAHAASM